MSRQFYSINGMDDVNIKRTFLESLSDPLGDETLCMMKLQRITLQQASLGEIYQHMLIALEKLCNQRKFLSEIEKVHSKLKDSSKGKTCRESAMRKVVTIQQKEEIISRSIL